MKQVILASTLLLVAQGVSQDVVSPPLPVAITPGDVAAPPESTDIVEALPQDLAEQLVDLNAVNPYEGLDLGRGVIDAQKAWDAGEDITVCFYGGSPALRQRVAQSASKWNEVSPYIRLVFGSLPDMATCSSAKSYDIRVGFTNRGEFSVIGKDSIDQLESNQISLNLYNFLRAAPSDQAEFNRRVLHEFGHALGFRHEHQRTVRTCDSEFYWNLVEAHFAGPPNFWGTDEVRRQMRQASYFEGAGPTQTSQFDRLSIMTYFLPKHLFQGGSASPCYSEKNSEISEQDKQIAREVYRPRNNAEKMALASAIEVRARERGVDGVRLAMIQRETRLSLVSKTTLRAVKSLSDASAIELFTSSKGIRPLQDFSKEIRRFERQNSLRLEQGPSIK